MDKNCLYAHLACPDRQFLSIRGMTYGYNLSIIWKINELRRPGFGRRFHGCGAQQPLNPSANQGAIVYNDDNLSCQNGLSNIDVCH